MAWGTAPGHPVAEILWASFGGYDQVASSCVHGTEGNSARLSIWQA